MQLIDMVKIAAPVIGFFSGIMFAHGASRMTAKEIYEISVLRHSGINKERANSLVRQKSDYIVGSFFLVIAFCLQVFYMTFPEYLQIDVQTPRDVLLGISCFLLLLLLASLYHRHRTSFECNKIHTLWISEKERKKNK
jgi:hypothetical protein